MYRITCDGYPLLDMRDDSLCVISPKCNLEVNTAGSASFEIHRNHPYYDKLKMLKSIFEISDDFGVIFRGRMTGDSIDFNLGKDVELEGAMGYFNDSIVRPFNFPDDFLDDPDYITAEESGNVVEFLLKWLIDNHNSQVQEFQKFKLGVVTVTDDTGNNYITRSDTGYNSTWDTLKSKLFDSALGGFLCIRYEEDGNYIDYLSEFTMVNTQTIEFGVNLLDRKRETDASATFSAVIPIGAEIEITDEEGNTTKNKLTIASLEDGNITDDIVKSGDMLYSLQSVEEFGWIFAPISETTWQDVTEAQNLLNKAVALLASDLSVIAEAEELTAADLHLTDAEIQSFRIYRKVKAKRERTGVFDTFDLKKLALDIATPQNTKISVGKTAQTITGNNQQYQSTAIARIQTAEQAISESQTEITAVKNQVLTESTAIINTCNEIILSALERYVETSNYDEFRETVEAQLSVLADEINMTFTTTTEQITNVDGDLQAKFTELYKFIRFSENGITIGDGESGITLSIDNDIISFEKNGQRFGWWDGTNFHTGNIYVDVNERAQFGNFAFIPRPDGSLSFLKVGD